MKSNKTGRKRYLQFTLGNLALASLVVAIVVITFRSRTVDGIRNTGRELDVAIIGKGYFRVSGPDGVGWGDDVFYSSTHPGDLLPDLFYGGPGEDEINAGMSLRGGGFGFPLQDSELA